MKNLKNGSVINYIDVGEKFYLIYDVTDPYHNFTVPFMIGSLIFPVVLAVSSANLIIRIISDFSIREIYQANGWG